MPPTANVSESGEYERIGFTSAATGSSARLVAAGQGHHVYIELEYELHEGSTLILSGRAQRPCSVSAAVPLNPCPKFAHPRPCRQLS